jgi:hypothetical protein
MNVQAANLSNAFHCPLPSVTVWSQTQQKSCRVWTMLWSRPGGKYSVRQSVVQTRTGGYQRVDLFVCRQWSQTWQKSVCGPGMAIDKSVNNKNNSETTHVAATQASTRQTITDAVWVIPSIREFRLSDAKWHPNTTRGAETVNSLLRLIPPPTRRPDLSAVDNHTASFVRFLAFDSIRLWLPASSRGAYVRKYCFTFLVSSEPQIIFIRNKQPRHEA